MLHSTIGSVALLIWKALQARGLDAAALFVRAGLDPDRLADANTRYPYSAMTRLWNLAVAETGDTCFGLTAAGFWHPTTLHALGYAWMASATLLEALERTERYFRVLSNAGALSIEVAGDELRVLLNRSSSASAPAAAASDAGLATIMIMCRTSSGATFAPRRVLVPHARPSCVVQFEEFFHCPIEFDAPHGSLVFDRKALMLPLPTANAELAHSAEQIIQSYLAHLDRSHVGPQVKARLVDALPSGTPEAETIAAALNLSLRSLQRKLGQEGTSFQQLLDETRRELAARYIENTRRSVSEIAYLLGFSEPANFTRAFRRWNGASPSDFRKGGTQQPV